MEPFIENIVNKLNSLPHERLDEVLNFIEFITWQEHHTGQTSIGKQSVIVNSQDFEALTNQLIDAFSRSVQSDVTSLSDYAVSRLGIYEEHP